MYNFYKDIASSDKVIIAKKEKDNNELAEYTVPKIEEPRFESMTVAYSITYSDDRTKIKKYYDSVKEYNEYIDFLNTLPGFLSAFIENDLMISKEQALTIWPEETVDKIFTSKQYLFKTPLDISQDVLYDCNFEENNYERTYSVSIEGEKIVFPVKDHFLITEHLGKKCIWNWVDNGRDFTLYLWDMLGSRYSQCDGTVETSTDDFSQSDDEDDDYDDEQVTYHFDCYDQFRYADFIDIDIQLVNIFEKLEKLGYLESYTVKPENFDPRWYHYGKSDGTMDMALIDESFKENKLLMEQIELLLWTRADILKKPYYILTDKDNKQYLSDTPGQFGGHAILKIYGQRDCKYENRFVKNGEYVKHRVFFADEQTAIAAGYRPCAKCMPEAYKKWKAEKKK